MSGTGGLNDVHTLKANRPKGSPGQPEIIASHHSRPPLSPHSHNDTQSPHLVRHAVEQLPGSCRLLAGSCHPVC